MAPKTNCNTQKLTTIHSWFRKSRSVWSLKELEKQLPAVSSINGMQVKDYIQTLQDDSKISCEKIGSGNWYWAFQSQYARNMEDKLAAAHAEYERISAHVDEFKAKLDARAAEIQKEMDGDSTPHESREELTARSTQLEGEIQFLKGELEAYSGCDPTEMEKMKEQTKTDYAAAELYLEDILAMESWFEKQGAQEVVATFPEAIYGDEYQWDEGSLIMHDPLDAWFFE